MRVLLGPVFCFRTKKELLLRRLLLYFCNSPFLRTAKNGSILHLAVLENWSPFQIATVLLIGKLFDIQLAVIRDEPP